MTKVNWGKASLFHLFSPCNSPPIRKVRAGTQAGQKLGSKNCCIDHEERCLLACSHGFLICFFILLSITNPPTISWYLTHQSSVKKRQHRLAQWPICYQHFLNYGLLFPNDSKFCQVDKTSQHTPDSQLLSTYLVSAWGLCSLEGCAL